MDRRIRAVALRLTGAFMAAVAPEVAAHADEGARSAAGGAVVGASMIVALLLYARGLAALWQAAGQGRGVERGRAWSYFGGWGVLAASLFGPVEHWSGDLFAVHMLQHELLMLVAAPLLVLGAPLATWSWGLPAGWRPRVGGVTRSIGRSDTWRVMTSPPGAWLVHGVAIWLWHVPVLFVAALESEVLHDLQHVTFLASALLFWWALLRPGTSRRADAVGVLLLFTTMLHTGALGALLTFSATPWYPYEGYGSFSAIEDQQLGGLLMWLPGGIVYAIAALALLARCLWEPRAGARAAR